MADQQQGNNLDSEQGISIHASKEVLKWFTCSPDDVF